VKYSGEGRSISICIALILGLMLLGCATTKKLQEVRSMAEAAMKVTQEAGKKDDAAAPKAQEGTIGAESAAKKAESSAEKVEDAAVKAIGVASKAEEAAKKSEAIFEKKLRKYGHIEGGRIRLSSPPVIEIGCDIYGNPLFLIQSLLHFVPFNKVSNLFLF
jgi:predicted Zn-dependent protease